jgi:PAS domain S-box-containing protein
MNHIAMLDALMGNEMPDFSLRSDDTRYRLLFEHMHEGFAHCRMVYERSVARDFIFLDVNEAFALSTGLKYVVGKKVSAVLPGFPDSNKELFAMYARVARGGDSEQLETFVPGIDRWLSISVYSFELGQFVAVFDDITERKNIERNLVESRERFQEIAETITEVFWVTDNDFATTRYISPAYEKVWGRSCRSLYADPRSFVDAIHPDDRERVLSIVRAMPQGNSFDVEYRVVQPEGAVRCIWDRGFPVKDPADGHVTHFVGVAVDVTDRRVAERKLSESENRFRALIEGATEPVLVANRDGVIGYASPAITSISGYEPAELIGRNFAEFVHPEDTAKVVAHFAATLAVPETIRRGLGRYRHKAGSWFSIETSARNLLDQPPINGIVINMRDVTDRIRAEAHLEHSLAVLRTQQEASIDGILVVDPAGKIISQNQRFLDLWQVPESLRGAADDAPLLAWVVGTVADPESFLFRVTHLYSHPEETSREEVALKDGRVFDRYSAPMHIGEGTHIGRVWFFRDITQHKHAEAKLQRANRALKTRSACDSALIHATSETSLYAEMCKILVDVGGYRMAWVGRAEPDSSRRVTPVAFAGAESGYLQTADISWADCERGHGATGACIRSGATQVMHINDALATPWRVEAELRGYAASIALPLKSDDGVFGSLSIHASEADAFDDDEIELLAELAEHLSFGVRVLRARIDNENNLRRVGQTLEATVHAIAGTVEMRDPYTAGHQRQVAELCVGIARQLGLSEERIRGLDLAASIHDLGKVSIPAEILSKPGRLTPIEFELVKTHPDTGYEIVKDIDFPWPIAEMVRQHHERLDGSGYPRGLKGDEILLEARIIAVADVLDAMASHRPYRPGLGLEAALHEITKQSGTKLDPNVVAACLALFREDSFDATPWSSTGRPRDRITVPAPDRHEDHIEDRRIEQANEVAAP